MINMNDKMKTILKEEENREYDLQIDIILNEIVDKTKMIKDCIIYDKDGTLKEEKINFDKIIKFVGDRTGYEVSCNELRFKRDMIVPNQFLILADKLCFILSQKYIGKRIIVYITVYDDDVELRFHTYREDERLWLDEDLNRYDIPILYYM